MKKYKYKCQSVTEETPIEVLNIINCNYKYDEYSGLITNTKTNFTYTKIGIGGYINDIIIRYDNIQFTIKPHRLIWFLKTQTLLKIGEMIDHVNGIRNDNKWTNLRKATFKENQQNVKKSNNKTYSSIYKGVCLEKRRTFNRYTVNIRVSDKMQTIGIFKNQELGAKFYDSAARFYHKEFASCNFAEIFIEPKSVEELRLLKQTKFKYN
jgi:hypothetical protein